MLTADHGESLGEHGEKTHALFVYDATVRVPLLLRYPALFPAGAVYPGPVRSIDIVPTVSRPSGSRAEARLRAATSSAAAARQGAPLDLPQYSESLLSELGFGMAPLHSLRQAAYKYIRAPRPELYDLRADPGELHNLYPSAPARAVRLERALDRMLEDSARHAHAARENPMSRESEEALRALGYVSSVSDRTEHGRDGSQGRDQDLQPARGGTPPRAAAKVAPGREGPAGDPGRDPRAPERAQHPGALPHGGRAGSRRRARSTSAAWPRIRIRPGC